MLNNYICTLTLTELDSIANQLLEQAQAVDVTEKSVTEAEANMPPQLMNPPDNYLVDQFNSGNTVGSGVEPPEFAGDDTG